MAKKDHKIVLQSEDLGPLIEELDKEVGKKQNRLNLKQEDAEQGLAKLVLTLVELLRKLLERQAFLRMENGSLTEEEIERLGEAFYKLEEKMQELKDYFGFKDEDLNIDLGPLGNLM